MGSHLDTPPFLVAAGCRGMNFGAVSAAMIPVAPLELRRADGAYSPVELAVLRGLI